jgi:chemotaxis family two-component system response regulator Rcp1
MHSKKKRKRIFNVLLVDDDKSDIYLFEHALSRQKTCFNLTSETDPEEALAKLLNSETHNYPHLILLDIKMPRLNGMEFLGRIKHDESLRKIPVVMLSGTNCPRTIKKAYKLHANGFIRKPCDMEKYRETAESLEEWWTSVLLPRS